MTSKNFQQNMVDQGHEIIFEVVKVSGNWAFPAAKSIVEATKGKNMYLRLTDSGKSDIFRLDSVKDGDNAGEKVFGFVGNGGMDLVELTATTDVAGVTTGTWEYAPGEGPAGEAIASIGSPLQWKGPATVAQLNAGIAGINPGWTYTLTDAGTLTDGSVTVDVGDEVAWTANEVWIKIGGETGKVAVFSFSGVDYPLIADMNAALISGKDVVLIRDQNPSRYDVFYLTYRNSGGGHIQMEFTGIEEMLYCTDDTWTVKPNSVAMATSIAPSYDSTQTYPTVGTAVMYRGLRYVSNTAITTAEDWTPAHWTEKSVEDEIGNVEALLAAL